ncbi:MAG: hypothetical protein NT163_03400 [Chlorobiales bacterium]|nr:hypothetical protein [Chlorobiales bacterium]
MLQLTKVTFTYNEVEDRIRMSAVLKGEGPMVFWLTQRLASRLVGALTDHLERSASRSSLMDRSLLLSCQQRDAEWQHAPSEPVGSVKDSLQVLPAKVDMSCSAEKVVLLFPLLDGEEAQLQMSLQELRQWLGIVYRQFKNAGWPLAVWPEWFTQAEPGRN